MGRLNQATSMQKYESLNAWFKVYPQASLGPAVKTYPMKNTSKPPLELCVYTWLQDDRNNIKGVYFLMHSFTKHTLADWMIFKGSGEMGDIEAMKEWTPTFENCWIDQLYMRGYDVVTLDHQSHGRSEGWNEWRCNTRNYNDFVVDALQLITSYYDSIDKDETGKKPSLNVLGFSMGGNIACRVIQAIFKQNKYEYLRPLCQKLALFAPMIDIKISWFTKVLIRIGLSLVAKFLPNARIKHHEGEENPKLAYIPVWNKRDPYIYTGEQKMSMTVQLLKGAKTLRNNIKLFPENMKILCVQGTNDLVVNPKGPEYLRKAKSNITIKYINGRSHYMTQENGSRLFHTGI